MRFAEPQLLWLLAFLPPLVVWFYWWAARQRQHLLSRFIQARLLPGLLAGLSPVRRRVRASLILASLILLVLALARPQVGFTWEEVRQRGRDIVVAIDTSKSMLAQDIAPNRLARAKLAALDLMNLARMDRLALIPFAGSAFLQCPLTFDDSVFRQSLDSLSVESTSHGGTALAEAIEVALTAFKEGDNHKVLVLLTDGEDHDSGAIEAARKASDAGLQIFTVGIGSADGELLRIRQPDGSTDYVRDEAGNVVKSRLNESLLRQIAGVTERGFYVPLQGAKTMETVFEKGLAPLPKSDSEEKLVKVYVERFHWPLALAILLLVAEWFFPERGTGSRVNSRPARVAAAVLAITLLGTTSHASTRSALKDYKAGRFEQSLNEYLRQIERRPDDPTLKFNAGTAAYRNQQFDEADKYFSQTLDASEQDVQLQQNAYFNRANSRFRQGEEIQETEKRRESWTRALKDFESSLKLNPADADAAHNRDYVKKRLEELQQPPPQQDQNQNDKKEDQPQDQQQQQQQNQQDNPQDQQQQSQQAEKQQSGSEQNQDQSKDQKEQQAQQTEKPEESKESKGQKEQVDPDQKEAEQQGQPPKPGAMSKEQARQLLDAQKEKEKMLPQTKGGKPQSQARRIMDW